MKINSKLAFIFGFILILLTAGVSAVMQQNTISSLRQEIVDLAAAVDKFKPNLDTLVFHVSEKGEAYSYAQLPNASYTYEQILALNKGMYEILLLPEYKGNVNWQEELGWIAADFGGPQGIPVMLDVFGGGSGAAPTPMLSVGQVSDALSVANVKCLRIAEVISWHLENKLPFPIDYVIEVLEFCRANSLGVFWTEWKSDYTGMDVDVFSVIQEYILGYEDVVTVSFSTNSQELEPTDGFLQLNQMFRHWGASIQSWYWNTTRGQDLMEMPVSLLLEHSLSAKGIGAKVIQFEPYWYLFDRGEPNDNLRLLLQMLA